MKALIGAIVMTLGAAGAQPVAAQGAVADGKVERPETGAPGIFTDLDRLVGPGAGARHGGVFTSPPADGRGGGPMFDPPAAGDPSTPLLAGSVGRMKYQWATWGLPTDDRFFTASSYGVPRFFGQDPRYRHRPFAGLVLASRP